MRNRLVWVAGLVAALVAASLVAGSAGAGKVPLEVPVTNGPCLAPSPSYCLTTRVSVSGIFQIHRFATENGALVAKGAVVDGDVVAFPATLFGAVFPDGTPLTLPVVDIDASCSSVTLTLQGSEPPSPPATYEPLPPVLFFDLVYQPEGSPPLTQSVAVGLLPATVTVQRRRGTTCGLASMVAHSPPPVALAGALNALI